MNALESTFTYWYFDFSVSIVISLIRGDESSYVYI